MAEAINGFGKTAAVLTEVGAAAEETRCKVVYACRARRQITCITEELSGLQKRHLIAAAPVLYAEYACHVRNPRKKGLVFLMDHRFDPETVRDLMPSWMKKDIINRGFTPVMLKTITEEFWDSR
jgi:Rad3-related DNA helicase